MSGEVGEAMQVARVSFDMFGQSLVFAKKGLEETIKFIMWFWKHTAGKNREAMKQLYEKCAKEGAMRHIIDVSDDDLKRACKNLDKAGVVYAVVPDINLHDGKKSIIFSERDLNIVNQACDSMILNLHRNENEFVESYPEHENTFLKETSEEEKELAKLPVSKSAQFVHTQAEISMGETGVSLETIKKEFDLTDEQALRCMDLACKAGMTEKTSKGYMPTENFAETYEKEVKKEKEIKIMILREDDNYERISLDKNTLLISEGEDYNEYILPGTGKSERIMIPKTEIGDDLYKGGSAHEAFLRKDREYEIFENNSSKTSKGFKTGAELRREHFDNKKKAQNFTRKFSQERKR